MGYGNRNTRERDLRPCRGCEAKVYWKETYCSQCLTLPERQCAGCERVSRTAGNQCSGCGNGLGRLTFGRDRLAAGEQRVGGWTGAEPHPEAVWTVAPGVHYYRGEVDERPLPIVKVKSPGCGWKPGAAFPSYSWAAFIRKGEGDPGTSWRKCFVCDIQLREGKRGQYDRFRERIVAVDDPTSYIYDKSQIAHPWCKVTPGEQAIIDAVFAARREEEAKPKPVAKAPTRSPAGFLVLPQTAAAGGNRA